MSLKKLLCMAVVLIIVCLPISCTANVNADESVKYVGYRELYLDYAERMDADPEFVLDQWISGFIATDMNTDGIPEVFAYLTSEIYADENGNIMTESSPAMKKTHDIVQADYTIEYAMSIVDGGVRRDSIWEGDMRPYFQSIPGIDSLSEDGDKSMLLKYSPLSEYTGISVAMGFDIKAPYRINDLGSARGIIYENNDFIPIDSGGLRAVQAVNVPMGIAENYDYDTEVSKSLYDTMVCVLDKYEKAIDEYKNIKTYYEKLYIDYAEDADEGKQNCLNNPVSPVSGMVLTDLNRDNVPEMILYSKIPVSDEGNSMIEYQADENKGSSRVLGTNYYTIESIVSIKNGKITEEDMSNFSREDMQVSGIPNADDDKIWLAVGPALVFGSESEPKPTVIMYERQEFQIFSEEIGDEYYAVKFPVASMDFYDEESGKTQTRSEAMKRILEIYDSESVKLVNCSEWAKEDIEKAKVYGLVPDDLTYSDLSCEITREEFAAVAVRLFVNVAGMTGFSAGTDFTVDNMVQFSDIYGNEFSFDIFDAYRAGIVNGTSETTFSPLENITREQLATMLSRVVKNVKFDDYNILNESDFSLDISNAPSFEDKSDVSAYASEAVAYMSKHGITKGVDEKRFAPQSTATREQAIIMALRMLENQTVWGN